MPVADGLQRTSDTLAARSNAGTAMFDAPLLQADSPSGIVAATPANAILATGVAGSITAGKDINFASQANLHHAATRGISLFTYGKSAGMHLHAASGKYSSQSQEGLTKLTADKMVTVASVNAGINVAAKQHVLLTSQGAAIRIEGGNITLNAPGKVEFKGSMKELAGPKDSSLELPELPQLAVLNEIEEYSNRLDVHDLYVLHTFDDVRFAAKRSDGRAVRGSLDEHGRSAQVYTKDEEDIDLLVGTSSGDWNLIYDYDDEQAS